MYIYIYKILLLKVTKLKKNNDKKVTKRTPQTGKYSQI